MNSDPTSLDRLHDIVTPPPAPWWPPAPGWYWVLGFLLLLAIALLIRAFISYQHNRYRREALAELARVDVNDRATAIPRIAELLKRTALSAWPRGSVASLTGLPWFAFLDQFGKTKSFSENHGELLENISYDPRTANSLNNTQTEALVRLTRDWIKHHRVK